MGGVLAEPYDPVQQAISQLAREGADTRPLMTAGLLAFGLLLPVWTRELGRRLGAATGRAALVAALATLAVAALPLTREPGGTQDLLHGMAAGTGYVAMALTPLLAARRLSGAARATSLVTGAVSASCLVGTVLAPDVSGLLQRTGLGVVDAWHVVVAVAVLLRRS